MRYYQQRMLSLTVYTWNGWISMNKSPFKSSDCHGRPGQLPTSRSDLKIAKIRWAWRIQKKTCPNGCDFLWLTIYYVWWFFLDYYLQLLLFHHKSGPMMIIYRPEETFWMMMVLYCYIWAFICISKYMYNNVYSIHYYTCIYLYIWMPIYIYISLTLTPRLELEIQLE